MANKMAEGLDAIGGFTYENVLSATQTIVDAMGKSAFIIRSNEVEGEGSVIALGFKKSAFGKWLSGGLWNAIANEPDLAAAIEIKLEDEKQHITVSIVDAATIQQTVMFIPVTTKMVQGMAQYREFLEHFTEALRNIDPSATLTRR